MIKCALSLLIIATCIVGTFADEFYEKPKKLDSECAKYCYQVAKPLLLMAPVCQKKDEEIIQLNSKIANLQNKLSVYEERERKSLEEGTKCHELNTKLADLQNKLAVYEERERKSLEVENKYNELNDKFFELNKKLAVYEYREKGFEDGNIELKTKVANLQNDLGFYKERERKSLEEGNMCNELNATLAELPRILLNLQDRERKGIEEVNKSKQLNEQLGEVQEKLADCEEREKKDIEEINLNKKVNVQLGEVQQKLADCEEREKNCLENNSKAESRLKASLEEYRVRLSNLEKAKEDSEKRIPKANCTIYASPGCTIYASPGVDTQRIIEVKGIEAFPVRCVNDLNSGPGWMLIQKRIETLEDNHFYKPWSTYRDGFGNTNGGFFIGLEKLYRLTNAEPHELYIEMEDWNGNKKFAHYDNFRVGDESEQYPLKDLGNYTPDSNAGDALRDNNNMEFSTGDRDNDNSPNVNCAYEYTSGWWHNNCTKANLNGHQYGTNEFSIDGIWWHSHVALKNTRMLIRKK